MSFYTVIKHVLRNTDSHSSVTSALERRIMDVRLSKRATLEQKCFSPHKRVKQENIN